MLPSSVPSENKKLTTDLFVYCFKWHASGARKASVPAQEPKVYPRDQRAWPLPHPNVLKSSGVFLLGLI